MGDSAQEDTQRWRSVPGAILPYGRQTISNADIAAVTDVLCSDWLTQGPNVGEFERKVAERCGAKHAVAVSNGTAALHVAMQSLGLKLGDRLWTSPITFVASANCGRYCGATVDFVDIDRDTGLMSVTELAIRLEQAAREGTLPKVLVPVHLTGSSCDMAAIGSLAERYGFAVLEDASHAIGGRYQGQQVGNCRYSDITVFSFHPVKIITTGEGGLATTNDPLLAQRMVEFRSHGITKDVARFELPSSGPWSYEQQKLGFNYRMTDLQAALGLSQLKRLDEIVIERNRQLQRYQELTAEDQRFTTGATDLLATLFRSRGPLLDLPRDAALATLDLLPPLRRRIAQRGTGQGITAATGQAGS